MNRQKSFENESPTLYLVATPIGNLDEMTYFNKTYFSSWT